MNPTQIAQSEAERIAQIAAESANQFLQAGTIGITFFSQIITLAAIIMVFVLIWFLSKRSGSEQLVIKQQSAQNADLIVELRKENENAHTYREKQLEATNKQADSNDALNSTMRSYAEKQSLLGETLDRMDTKLDRVDIGILNVVNGFGALSEGMRSIEGKVKDNPADHRTVIEVLTSIRDAQMKIFTLIDSRLPASARTDTPTMLPPGHFTAPPSADLINIKRGTGEAKAVKPEDTDLKPTG